MRRFSRLFDKNYKKPTRIFENRNRKTSKQEQIFSKIAAEKWIIISSNFKNQDVNLNKLTSLLEDTDGKPRKLSTHSENKDEKIRKSVAAFRKGR